MPKMPFIGVRISWLIAARNRDLARLAASACLRASLRSASVRRGSVMSRPEHCTSEMLASPATTACSSHSNQRGPRAVSICCAYRGGRQGSRGVAGEHARREEAPQHPAALDPGGSTEGLIDEGQATLCVAPQNDIGLVVQEIAIARLVVAELPLDVLARLETALQARAPARQVRGRCPLHAGSTCPRSQPGSQATWQGPKWSHA